METHKIKILFKALELGSLTKAANAMGYSQPAVTQMIRSMEESLGFSLLEKTNKGVKATAEGERLIPLMREILDDEENFHQEAAEIRGMHSGTLRVGSFVSTSVHWLPSVLEYFQKNHPLVNINIIEGGQDDLTDLLLDRRIDVALLSEPSKKSLEFIPVYKDPLVVAFSPRYDLSGYESVTMEDIKDYPLLLTENTYDRDVYRLIEQSGYEPDVRYTSRDDYAVLSMVRHGLGISILPKLVVEGFSKDFSVAAYRPEFYRTLGVAVRSWADAGPLVRFLIQFIKENM